VMMTGAPCDVSWGCSCDDWNSVGWGCNVMTGVPGWVPPGAVCALGLRMGDKVTGLLMWLGYDKVTGVPSKGSRMVLKER
jgi:hypothetical protein